MRACAVVGQLVFGSYPGEELAGPVLKVLEQWREKPLCRKEVVPEPVTSTRSVLPTTKDVTWASGQSSSRVEKDRSMAQLCPAFKMQRIFQRHNVECLYQPSPMIPEVPPEIPGDGCHRLDLTRGEKNVSCGKLSCRLLHSKCSSWCCPGYRDQISLRKQIRLAYQAIQLSHIHPFDEIANILGASTSEHHLA